MTKLMQWLFVAVTLAAVWLALLTGGTPFSKNHYTLLLVSPVIAVGLFGLCCLALVLYRVYTFNNCDEAAVELKMEIVEAKEDLKRLGFKFKD